MKTLVIDNNIDLDCWGSKDLCKWLTQSSPDNTVYVRRAPQGDLPASPLGFDRVVVSGSKTSGLEQAPWVNDLMKFMEKCLDAKIPLLGICFGHQLLARLMATQVKEKNSCLGLAKQAEFGWTEIQLCGQSALTQGLPPKFHSFSAHFEEVSRLPHGLRALAQSHDCQFQAFEVEGYPAFGLQFHPEKSPTEAIRILQERKKVKKPKKLFLDRRGTTYYDPKIGEILFKNFLGLAPSRK